MFDEHPKFIQSTTLHLKRIVISLCASLLIFSHACDAEDSARQDTVAMTGLPELFKEAFERNPAIQASRARWQSVIERYPQATALPDPMLAYGYFAQSVETRVGPQNHRIGLKQGLPWPGKRKARGEVVKADVRIAHLQYETSVRNVVVALKTSYHELLYLNAAVELTRQNQALLDNVLRLVTAQYAENKSNLNDVLRAQSQLGQLGYDLITLRELALVESTNINTLLNRSPEEPLSIEPSSTLRPLSTPLTSLYELALERRHEIRIARERMRRGEKSVSLAQLESKPDISLDLLYIETGEALNSTLDSGKDPLVIGMAINIPIWGSKNRARVSEAVHARRSAAFSLEDIRNKTLASVKNIYFKLENSRRLEELYRKQLVPQAKKSMEISETWYKDGKGSFSDFLETQSIWLNFNLAWQRAIADYHRSLAKMEQITGGKVE